MDLFLHDQIAAMVIEAAKFLLEKHCIQRRFSSRFPKLVEQEI